jgi:Lrp/AsnC family transcriptional regulator for asnA, asnC and gidA
MRPRVDALDQEILELLPENARMPCAEMARRLGGVSARTISNRVKRLTEEGTIAIMAGAVPSALGYNIAAGIYIEVEPLKVTEVADALIRLEPVVYVAITTGDADLSIQAHATDMQDLRTFITEHVHAISGVRRTKTFIIMQVLKQSCDWQFPSRLP